MRKPIVFLASLLVFSHVSAADTLIRLPQPLHLEVPKSATTKPADSGADKSAASASAKEVAKTDMSASASASASAKPAAAGKEDVSMSAEDKAQQELAEKIKARLQAIREKTVAQIAAKANPSLVVRMKAKRKQKSTEAREENKQEHKHWAYEGEDGPANWGKLNPAWAQCATGKRQSPIDIHDGIKVDLEPIQFDYKPVHFKVTDTGHTIQVDLEPGNQFTLTGHVYELLQFHFHRPSEEHVNGRNFQMVVHLVHKGDDGKLAVVALLVDEGVANGIIQNVWNNLPLEKSDPVVPTGVIDVSQLLPMSREYYTYMGSLTTPPCSEEVLWMVMKQPIKMSTSQINIFARLYPMNARPIQKNEDRMIKESN